AEGQAIFLRFAIGDQFLRALYRSLRIHDKKERNGGGHGDRLQILPGVISQVAIEGFQGRVRRRRIQEGIAVVRGSGYEVVAYPCARARFVLDNEWLSQLACQIVSKHPRGDIVGTSRSVWRDDLHGARGPIVLCEGAWHGARAEAGRSSA